jgi:hypothetical protein
LFDLYSPDCTTGLIVPHAFLHDERRREKGEG